jgi:hypothetical protein
MTKAINSTGHLFATRKTPDKGTRDRTSETIAADVLAFQLAGGTIEKLGTTCALKHIPAQQVVPPTPVRSRSRAKSAG